jgi:hypothetical protein
MFSGWRRAIFRTAFVRLAVKLSARPRVFSLPVSKRRNVAYLVVGFKVQKVTAVRRAKSEIISLNVKNISFA